MSIVDTPDHQQSTVSAQKLLAVGLATDQNLTVDIPPNAETLLVALSLGAVSDTITVAGLTSGISYSGGQLIGSPTSGFTQTWAFDISAPVDAQVQITLGSVPGEPWYVYVDAGVHTVVDLATRRDPSGSQYVLPIVPGTVAGYHPPDEVLIVGNDGAGSFHLLAAPGAGKRYRIFGACMASTSSDVIGLLIDSISGQWLLVLAGPGNAQVQFPAQGVALSANGPLGYLLGGGTGTTYCQATYTIEAV
ncbi:MAG: hypothetical protein ACRDNS_08530 [Trebonia sp.]